MIEPDFIVRDGPFMKSLLRFWAYGEKSIREVIRAQARLLAVELARRTQPFGDGPDAQEQGRKATRRDIRRVFKGPDDMRARFQGSLPGTLGASILRYIESGSITRLREVLASLSRPINVTSTLDPNFHQKQRNSRGRIPKGRRMIYVADQSAIDEYIVAEEKLVGKAKGGWAAAARALGGARGIPSWVSRQKSAGGITNRLDSKTAPAVVLRNSVSYASVAISTPEIANAFTVQRNKMQAALNKSLAYEAKRSGLAA